MGGAGDNTPSSQLESFFLMPLALTIRTYHMPFSNKFSLDWQSVHGIPISGGVIMFGALLLFEDEFIHVVSISFTALILTELIMVALTIRTWHWLMVVAEFLSLAIYILSLIILKVFFGKLLFNTESG